MDIDINAIKKILVDDGVTQSERDFLYRLVLKYKPTTVIETGSGASSLSILAGLSVLQQGMLHSIDLPGLENRTTSAKEAWYIIQNSKLNNHWKIYEDNVYNRLPILIVDIQVVDMFFHDSKHTSEHVRFEFNLVNSKLRVGGLFGMHDIRLLEMQEILQHMNGRKDFRFIGKKRQAAFWIKEQQW